MKHNWNLEKLAKLSAYERANVLENASKNAVPDLIDMIINSGLAIKKKGGFNEDDFIIRKIKQLCYSDEGIRACEIAVENGLPPLAGVDPMITEALPKYYGTLDTGTWAGTFVSQIMSSKGYIDLEKSGKLPPGSTLKTGKTFKAP